MLGVREAAALWQFTEQCSIVYSSQASLGASEPQSCSNFYQKSPRVRTAMWGCVWVLEMEGPARTRDAGEDEGPADHALQASYFTGQGYDDGHGFVQAP